VKFQFDVHFGSKIHDMATEYKFEEDGSITITTRIKPEGSMLEREEPIAVRSCQIGLG